MIRAIGKPSLLKPVRGQGRQSGVALVVALVFLLALSMIGIATLSTMTVEARMAYSYTDYLRAFQAADSGVSAGERWLDAQTVKPIATTGCQQPGSCSTTDLVWDSQIAPAVADWFAFDWTRNGRVFGFDYLQDGTSITFPDHALSRAAVAPRYLVEEIGKDSSGSLVSGIGPTYSRTYYRITAIGSGADPGTTTIVQSVYLRPF